MCDVSVIIPVYNVRNEVLYQCVRSVSEQEEVNIEIFIIDDGSKVECAKFCDEFGKKDSRIKVIHQKNQGVSVARNEGIKRANGKWIAFVDADDWIEPNMLHIMTNYGNEKEVDIVLCDCFVNYSRQQVETHFFEEKELEIIDKDSFILRVLSPRICNDKTNVVDTGMPWAKLYRKSFIWEKNLFFDKALRRMQDNIFNLYAYECAESIYYIHQPLYHYRKGVNSGICRYNPQIVKIYDIYFQRVLEFINCFNKSDQYRSALDYKIFFSIYVILKNDILNKDNPNKFMDKREKILSILDSPYYMSAIKRMEIKYLNNLEKIFLFLVRNKLFIAMCLAIKIKNLVYKITGKGVEK